MVRSVAFYAEKLFYLCILSQDWFEFLHLCFFAVVLVFAVKPHHLLCHSLFSLLEFSFIIVLPHQFLAPSCLFSSFNFFLFHLHLVQNPKHSSSDSICIYWKLYLSKYFESLVLQWRYIYLNTCLMWVLQLDFEIFSSKRLGRTVVSYNNVW